MKKIYLLLFYLLIVFNFIINIYVYAKAESKSFFPENINMRLRTNLTAFLKTIPKNKGQQQHIDELMNYSEYKKILLFIDSSFSPDVLNEISKLENPFLLMEALDILSYNLKLEDYFSNWYLSKLILLVKKEPSIYMPYFLMLCQKSDGLYSEWFSDPLAKIIKNYAKDFSVALLEIKEIKKLCMILKLGDYKLASNSLEILSLYNQTNHNKYVSELLNCFKQ